MLFSIPGGLINLFVLWIVLQLYFLRPSIKEFFGQCKSKEEVQEQRGKRFKKILDDKYQVKYFSLKMYINVNLCV